MADAPTPDELRAIARDARNSSGSASDDCGPSAYVLAGWNAAIAAQPPAEPLTPPAVETALRDAISVISSINGGHANRVMKNGEAVYWQRREWIDWARLEVLPTIKAALDLITTHKDAP